MSETAGLATGSSESAENAPASPSPSRPGLLARVARPTPSLRVEPLAEDRVRFPVFGSLDSLRALGIISVSYGHQISLDTLTTPTVGVRIGYHVGFTFGLAFFVLSGYLLFRPFASTIIDGGVPAGANKFIWRRLWRIVPAYWLVLTIALIFDRAIEKPDNVLGVIALYTFVYPYFTAFFRLGMVQAWTLCAEIVFYVALPFVAAWLGQRARKLPSAADRVRWLYRVLGVTLAAALLFRIGLSVIGRNFAEQGYRVNYMFLNYIDWFALGMLMAAAREAWVRGVRLPRWLDTVIRYPAIGLLAAASFWWLVFQMHHPLVPIFAYPSVFQYVMRLELLGIAVACMIAPFCFRTKVPGRAASLLSGPALSYAAKISYGYFLWHFLVIHQVEERYGYPSSLLDALGRWVPIAAVTFTLGALSYRFVEIPAVNYSERLWKRREAARAGMTARPAQQPSAARPHGSGPWAPAATGADSGSTEPGSHASTQSGTQAGTQGQPKLTSGASQSEEPTENDR